MGNLDWAFNQRGDTGDISKGYGAHLAKMRDTNQTLTHIIQLNSRVFLSACFSFSYIKSYSSFVGKNIFNISSPCTEVNSMLIIDVPTWGEPSCAGPCPGGLQSDHLLHSNTGSVWSGVQRTSTHLWMQIFTFFFFNSLSTNAESYHVLRLS